MRLLGYVSAAVLFVLALSGNAVCAFGADPKSAADPTQQFFAEHCRGCHAGAKPKGDFRLESLSQDFADDANRKQWLKVFEQVKEGTMPPAKKPRPPVKDVETLTAWISGRAAAAEIAASASRGRVVMRRLNRAEYKNSVRDLLGVDVELDDVLPEDTSSGGFDNSAEALHVSSYLMDGYLEAADRVIDAAVAGGPQPWTIKKRFDVKDERSVKPTGSVYRHVDDGVAIFSSWVSANIQVALWQFTAKTRGKYRIRLSAYGFQCSKPVTFHVMVGPSSQVHQRLVDYFEAPPDKPTVVEFVAVMNPQETIRVVTDGLPATPPDIAKVGADHYKGPGLVIQWIDIDGPLGDSWPPQSHRGLFGDLPQAPLAGRTNRREVVSQQPLVDAERILRDFTRRAFRRTVTEEDIQPFLARVQTQLEKNESFEQAMRVGLQAVLVSQPFLFLREKPGQLDDFAMAARLSYFLWSSTPDETLLAVAEQGKLSNPDVLREQIERMLQDPRAVAFTENFAGQWLGLRGINATMPDSMLYPEFDDMLKVSMAKETLLFFDEVLKSDLSLTNFIDCDFAILNSRLAKHYGIPGVEGLEFRKVALPPESHRGGVLTMASVLKVTANGTTTSPILRGAWVLDRILGTPPPKPTVDVEAVEPDIRGATTIRDQLAKHRQSAECASCHIKIDPPGFALENFDVIGGWRDHYRSIGAGEPVIVDGRKKRYLNGPKVDAADVLPDGRQFQNIDEFKQLLLADKDQLARALTEKLLTYATGAAPTIGDRAEIESIVHNIAGKNYGFRSLVHEIVQSKVFQSK
jgi:hypothetical protein